MTLFCTKKTLFCTKRNIRHNKIVFSSKLKKKYLDKNIDNDYIWRNLIFMSLIKCYECPKEISDIDESCPNCGAGKDIECHECSKKII